MLHYSPYTEAQVAHNQLGVIGVVFKTWYKPCLSTDLILTRLTFHSNYRCHSHLPLKCYVMLSK